MPKYTFDEETLREYGDLSEQELAEIESEHAHWTREEDGQLSQYEAAQCEIDFAALGELSLLAYQELEKLGATQISINYDGGGDEGFAHWDVAKTPDGDWNLAGCIEKLKSGPLGEKIERGLFYHAPEEELSRAAWTREALETLAHELATQLLGQGFGTGEYSLEGSFLADLNTKTLTDVPPSENQ